MSRRRVEGGGAERGGARLIVAVGDRGCAVHVGSWSGRGRSLVRSEARARERRPPLGLGHGSAASANDRHLVVTFASASEPHMYRTLSMLSRERRAGSACFPRRRATAHTPTARPLIMSRIRLSRSRPRSTHQNARFCTSVNRFDVTQYTHTACGRARRGRERQFRLLETRRARLLL